MTENRTSAPAPGPMIPEEVRRHFQAARREIRAGFRGLLPPEVLLHGRAARREMLLALRAVIDAALERAENERASAD